MSHTPCAFCQSPIPGTGYQGRPWPDAAPARYCCFGCLSLGEQQCSARQCSQPNVQRVDGPIVRLGIALLIAGQSMIFGLAVNLTPPEPTTRLVLHGLILAATLLVVALLGVPLFRTAAQELRRGQITTESLFVLTLLGALGASLQSMLTGRGAIYFEVVSILLVVYTLGKLIGARGRAAALASTHAWSQALAHCRVVDAPGSTCSTPVAKVLSGDTIEVHAGEAIPVDGVIQTGIGFVSEAPVSGEPFAVVRRPGDRVLAGSVAYDATFQIAATSAGTSRQIDRVLATVEQARHTPTSLQAQADQMSQVFVPVVLTVALGTFVGWWWAAGWQSGLFNAMAVLLVACPCALGLATPIVLWSTLSRLAERGLVVRQGDVVERLAEVDYVLFDKTGTLTEDQVTVVDIATLVEGNERARLLGWLAMVEEHSQHPIARAFAALPRSWGPDQAPHLEAVRMVAGQGVEAWLRVDGRLHCLRVGRPDWLGGTQSPQAVQLTERLLTRTGHRVDVEVDGQRVAVAIVNERVRDSAEEALAELMRLGDPLEIITGDTAERAMGLGVSTVQGHLTPQDKVDYVDSIIKKEYKPLMIGDGINDAAALSRAHVGVALASGTDLANDAAGLTLYHADLRTIPWALTLARQAKARMQNNLYRAATYNMVGMSIAAAGWLHPVLAALLMMASSLLVVWSSSRIGLTKDLADCHVPDAGQETSTGKRGKAFVHALALAAQGALAVALLSLSGVVALGTMLGFTLLGVGLAWRWYDSPRLSHRLDMAFTMLTLGNLGMLAGWWVDQGFAPLTTAACGCHIGLLGEGSIPWGMWLGMLLGANLGMRFLGRARQGQPIDCRPAMLIGGNLGMLVGMLVGSRLGITFAGPTLPQGAIASFVGMTVGMIVGMSLGSGWTRCWFDEAMRLRRKPGVLTRSSEG